MRGRYQFLAERVRNEAFEATSFLESGESVAGLDGIRLALATGPELPTDVLARDEKGTSQAVHRSLQIDRRVTGGADYLMGKRGLLLSAQGKWRRLNATQSLPKVIARVQFEDGIQVVKRAA
ncbi:MAG: hypothetical protein OXD30_13570 [Bryobacterales bacterium]|nr:hypothetical protein [Bryobacterales bacterium]